MELQEQAKELYKTLPAKEIAVQLGVSESTVRRWVKGVSKRVYNQYDVVVDKLYTLATRPQGVRQKEEWLLYAEHYGNSINEETGEKLPSLTESQKSYIRSLVKAKAIKEGNIALFVPDWVAPTEPRLSWESMLAMTNEMYDRMQEYVNGYMYEFDMPKDSRYAVTQQLLVLLVPEYSPRNILDVCKQATDVVDTLEQRKELKEKKVEPLPKEVTEVFESMKDIEHFIY